MLVYIAPPPKGILTLFNLYVALSRSSRKDTTRLLCDFDDGMFRKTHDPAFLQEVERLEKFGFGNSLRGLVGAMALLL